MKDNANIYILLYIVEEVILYMYCSPVSSQTTIIQGARLENVKLQF